MPTPLEPWSGKLETLWVGKWRLLCNPKFDYFLEHVTSVFSGPNYFWLPDVRHFHNKMVSAQRNTHSIQILWTAPPNNCLFRGEFSFVHRKCHTSFRFVYFFHIEHGVGLPFTHKVSDVVSGTKHFALKLTLKF